MVTGDFDKHGSVQTCQEVDPRYRALLLYSRRILRVETYPTMVYCQSLLFGPIAGGQIEVSHKRQNYLWVDWSFEILGADRFALTGSEFPWFSKLN
jgi:hypothetical protein